MKKVKKYQSGGATRVFNTPVPRLQEQSFTPLIQVASQPIETGFNAYKFIEDQKLQKLQEERYQQQMDLQKLQMQMQLEQREQINEDRRLAGIDKLKHGVFDIAKTAYDVGLMENLKSDSKYGLNDLENKINLNPSQDNINHYREKLVELTHDPDYIRITRRSKSADLYNNYLKTQFNDANKDGYIDDSNIRSFEKGELDNLGLPIVKPGYAQFQEYKLNDAKLKDSLLQLKVNHENEVAKISLDLNTDLKPLWEQFNKATTDKEREEITKKIEAKKLIYSNKVSTLNSIYDITSSPLQRKLTQDDEAEAWGKQFGLGRYASVIAYPEYIKEKMKFAANNPLDPTNYSKFVSLNQPNVRSFLQNLQNIPKVTDENGKFRNPDYSEFVNQINNTTMDGKPYPIKVSGTGDSVYNGQNEVMMNASTVFIPSNDNTTFKGNTAFVPGTIYREISRDQLKNMSDQWEEVSSVPNGVNVGKKLTSNDKRAIVSRRGEFQLLAPENTTNTFSTPSFAPKSFNSKVEEDLNKNNVFIKDTADSKYFVNAPNETLKAVKDLSMNRISDDPKVSPEPLLGKIVISGSKHHNDHHNFDLGLNSNPQIANILQDKEELNRLKEWAIKHNYAIVYESNLFKGQPSAFNNLKIGDIKPSPLSPDADADHLHFEYIGSSKSNRSSIKQPTFLDNK